MKIKQIVQHHFNFITLTPNLFTLNMEDIYYQFHAVPDSHIASKDDPHISFIAHSLLSIFQTCRKIPVIYYTKGLNEPIFEKLKELFEEYLSFLSVNDEDAF